MDHFNTVPSTILANGWIIYCNNNHDCMKRENSNASWQALIV